MSDQSRSTQDRYNTVDTRTLSGGFRRLGRNSELKGSVEKNEFGFRFLYLESADGEKFCISIHDIAEMELGRGKPDRKGPDERVEEEYDELHGTLEGHDGR